ncbi:ribbon-helix-helix protein, CopG family [Gracilimonas halophila]|uniref:Ribbon-helix-helix protein, CopG family n=1 Tax=Gracilimonas halophila TaxID=1834464 RepID=A0ABW5JI81_9BACT
MYLTEEEKKAIEKLSNERGTTQSNIIREAIEHYLEEVTLEKKRDHLMAAAGMWKDKENIPCS